MAIEVGRKRNGFAAGRACFMPAVARVLLAAAGVMRERRLVRRRNRSTIPARRRRGRRLAQSTTRWPPAGTESVSRTVLMAHPGVRVGSGPVAVVVVLMIIFHVGVLVVRVVAWAASASLCGRRARALRAPSAVHRPARSASGPTITRKRPGRCSTRSAPP